MCNFTLCLYNISSYNDDVSSCYSDRTPISCPKPDTGSSSTESLLFVPISPSPSTSSSSNQNKQKRNTKRERKRRTPNPRNSGAGAAAMKRGLPFGLLTLFSGLAIIVFTRIRFEHLKVLLRIFFFFFSFAFPFVSLQMLSFFFLGMVIRWRLGSDRSSNRSRYLIIGVLV